MPGAVRLCDEFGWCRSEETMRTMNLNDTVLVKLTDHGRELMRKNYEALWAWHAVPPYEFKLPKEDADGFSKWQLWSLMQEFGAHIHMGMRNPFDLTIRVQESADCYAPAPASEPKPSTDPMDVVRSMCR